MFNVNKFAMDNCAETLLCDFGWETAVLPKEFTHSHSQVLAQHSHLGQLHQEEVTQDSVDNW